MEDKAIILHFQQGHGQSFNLLVNKYKKRVYFFALKLLQNHEDAEDLTQETFIRAYKGLMKFRGDSSFLNWLFCITANGYRSFKRKRQLRVAGDIDLNTLPQQILHKIDDNLHSAETEQLLHQAISRLPKKQKLVLVLRTFEELGYQEIADVVGISINSVKANLSYARQALRKELGDVLQ